MNFIPLGEGLFFSICRGYLDTLISFFLVLFAFIFLFLLLISMLVDIIL